MAPRQRLNSSTATQQQQDDVDSTGSESTAGLLPEDSNRDSKLSSSVSASKNLPTEADIARDQHDYFNLVALVPVIVCWALNYDLEKAWKLEAFQWTGNHFLACFMICQVYFFADLVWVAKVPICVKSPNVIIKHHMVAMLYLFAPMYCPQYRWFLGAVLSVEINTYFLILRRVLYKASQQGINLSPIITESVSALFYISWIIIRCIVYPGVLVSFLTIGYEVYFKEGLVFEMLFIPLHSALCALNLKWTYDLFKPIVQGWFYNTDTVTVSNGL